MFGRISALALALTTLAAAVVLVEDGRITAAGSRLAVPAGARVVDLGDASILGTIEDGKQADLLGVPGDVLRSISATEHVRFVMKGGKVVRDDRAAPGTSARF